VKGKKRQAEALAGRARGGSSSARWSSCGRGWFSWARARGGGSFCIYLYKTDRHTCTHTKHTHTHITQKRKGSGCRKLSRGNEALGKIED